MSKFLHVARREFSATVLAKGCIIGMLVTPAMIGVVVIVFPRMINRNPPRIVGGIAVIDPPGR